MTVIIDLVIIAIITLCIIIGYIKGLTGSLVKILSFILSLVIAFILFVPVSNFVINHTQIDDNIERTIRQSIIDDKNKEEKNKTMPTAITDYISQKVEEAADGAKETIVDNTAKDVAQTIVKAGTWVALFIIARIALILLRFVTSLITKLPVIKQFDKLGGIVYGLVEGLIITYTALALISFISPMTKNNSLSENIQKSYVGSKMYNNNLLLNIIF